LEGAFKENGKLFREGGTRTRRKAGNEIHLPRTETLNIP